jgi:2-iminoacetate synthase ThiH
MSAQQQPSQYQEMVQETENEERTNMMQGKTATAPEPLIQQQSDANAIHLSGVKGDKVRFASNVYILSRNIC